MLLVNLSNQEVILRKGTCIGQLIEVAEVTVTAQELSGVAPDKGQKTVGSEETFGEQLEEESQREVVIRDDDPVVRTTEPSPSSELARV